MRAKIVSNHILVQNWYHVTYQSMNYSTNTIFHKHVHHYWQYIIGCAHHLGQKTLLWCHSACQQNVVKVGGDSVIVLGWFSWNSQWTPMTDHLVTVCFRKITKSQSTVPGCTIVPTARIYVTSCWLH